MTKRILEYEVMFEKGDIVRFHTESSNEYVVVNPCVRIIHTLGVHNNSNKTTVTVLLKSDATFTMLAPNFRTIQANLSLVRKHDEVQVTIKPKFKVGDLVSNGLVTYRVIGPMHAVRALPSGDIVSIEVLVESLKGHYRAVLNQNDLEFVKNHILDNKKE